MYGQGQPAEEAWATGTAEAAGQATPELTEPDVEFQQPERSTWMDPAGSEPDLPAGGDQAAAAERPLPWDAPEETFDAQASPEATPAGGAEAPEMAEAAPIASTVTEAGDDHGPSAGPDPWEPAAEESSSSQEVGPAVDSPDPDHGRSSSGPDSNGTSSEDVLPPTQQMDVITLDDPDPPGDDERADVSEPAPIFSSATAGAGATFGGSSGGRGLAGDVRPEAAFDDQDDGEERSLRELFWGED
jgi:hypothetical protein